ncbi:MAG TPA: type II toxin-antitoxin system HicB family antitoxin [Candidatus Gracilibacteria bacterium]|nr:type II toxin-antitoxin system HicB family antitoxin [Candidatus Gracilibacteria bacterium]
MLQNIHPNMAKDILKNIVWKEGKYYVAQCLNVDVSSFGKTKKEALKNLNEALDLYFEDSKKIVFVKIERPEIVDLRLRHA